MAFCKHKIRGNRYSRNCDEPTQRAVIFTTALDVGYLITTQQPICANHMEERCKTLSEMGVTYRVGVVV